MDNKEAMFEIETLKDWHLDANLEDIAPVEGGGASNSNSSNNSADQP